MTTPFTGYPGQVWRTAYASLQWLSGVMATSSNNPEVVANPALLVYDTLRNAVDAVTAFSVGAAWAAEVQALQAIQVLPLTLDTTTAAYFNARIAAYVGAAPAISALVPPVNPANAATLLGRGTVAVPDPGLLPFFMSFYFEVPPAIDVSSADFLTDAQAAATAWQTVGAAISVLQGAAPTQAQDTATRQYLTAQQTANTVAAFTSGGVQDVDQILDGSGGTSTDSSGETIVDGSGDTVLDGSGIEIGIVNRVFDPWNTIVTLPAMLADAAILGSAPFSAANQQSGVIRYALISTLNQLAYLLLSLRQPTVGITNLATLYNNDSLLDFAARNTGNFENWTSIATANALQPPWTGPGAAPFGSQLFIPAPGTSPPTPGVAQPTYAANVLGTDIYVGPINGQMPAWTGDYQLITGYANLAISLGRRLQTPLGALVYDTSFGSRIPPEVGNVQDSTTAGHIAAYGQSALLSDPRTGSVLNATATIQPGGLGLVEFNATVVPIGQGSTPTSLNEVISPPG